MVDCGVVKVCTKIIKTNDLDAVAGAARLLQVRIEEIYSIKRWHVCIYLYIAGMDLQLTDDTCVQVLVRDPPPPPDEPEGGRVSCKTAFKEAGAMEALVKVTREHTHYE